VLHAVHLPCYQRAALQAVAPMPRLYRRQFCSCLTWACLPQTLPPGTYLSSLIHLELSGSNLLCIPESLTAAARLHTLALPGNRHLRVGCHADLALLRQLPSLAELELPWRQPQAAEEAAAQAALHACFSRALPRVRVAPPPQFARREEHGGGFGGGSCSRGEERDCSSSSCCYSEFGPEDE
jgi:hypothetical protein